MKKLVILTLLAGGLACFGTERVAEAGHGRRSRSGFSLSFGTGYYGYSPYSAYRSRSNYSSYGGYGSRSYYSPYRSSSRYSRPSVGYNYYQPGFSFSTRSRSHGSGCCCGCCR